MVMYLEADLSAQAPTSLPVVNGAQQLDVGTAGGIMAFLQDKYLLPASPAGDVTNWIAKPAAYLASQGYQLEGQMTAAQQIQALGGDLVAIVNLDDVRSVAMGDVIQDFHVSIAPASKAASLAPAGANFAVLWPLTPVGSSTGSEEPAKKSMVLPITLALVGGGGGALVAGPLGAVVGGIGGYMLGYAAA